MRYPFCYFPYEKREKKNTKDRCTKKWPISGSSQNSIDISSSPKTQSKKQGISHGSISKRINFRLRTLGHSCDSRKFEYPPASLPPPVAYTIGISWWSHIQVMVNEACKKCCSTRQQWRKCLLWDETKKRFAEKKQKTHQY